MRSPALYCLLCLILSSCSLPLASLQTGQMLPGHEDARLLNIRIERWGELRFTGLLALRLQGDGLSYVLLDATGVKLLETQLSRDGSPIQPGSAGVLKDSELAEFLPKALARTYLLSPEKLPCSRNWLVRFCYHHEDVKKWYKSAQMGPVTLWRATEKEVQGKDNSVVSYSQPWLGVRIFLESVKE